MGRSHGSYGFRGTVRAEPDGILRRGAGRAVRRYGGTAVTMSPRERALARAAIPPFRV